MQSNKSYRSFLWKIYSDIHLYDYSGYKCIKIIILVQNFDANIFGYSFKIRSKSIWMSHSALPALSFSQATNQIIIPQVESKCSSKLSLELCSIISSPGPPGVGPVCEGVDDRREPVHWDDDHHKTRHIESKDPATKIRFLAFWNITY